MENKIIVGLDIGSTKIGVVIAEIDDDNKAKIVGIGSSISDGLSKGCVVNIDKTVKSIQKAVDEATLMAGTEAIKNVYVSIAGDHVNSLEGRGMTSVIRQDNEIKAEDVFKVIETAKTIQMPPGKEIFHAIPQGFVVDDEQTGIKDPIGMSGIKLEGYVHLVTGASTAKQNIFKSVSKCGLNIEGVVVSSLASAYSVLENDERELGVALIDIGGGTSDVTVYIDNSIHSTFSIGFGGKNVTSDLAIGIRTPLERAEEIKIKEGTCSLNHMENDKFIIVPGVGGRPQREIPGSLVASIIRARVKEIFEMIRKELHRQGLLEKLGAGLVITGGASRTNGIMELAEETFHTPVKLTAPRPIGGLSDAIAKPENATGVGLVQYGLKRMELQSFDSKAGMGNESVKKTFSKFFNIIKNYI